MSGPHADRNIAFEAIDNFRDLGGLRTRDGGVIRRGHVFRSGDPRHMTESDYAKLTGDLGVRTILDLRRPDELEDVGVSPLIKPPVRHVHIRLVQAQNLESVVQQTQSVGSVGAMYQQSLEDVAFGRNLTFALELLSHEENRPALFHCSLGKDRVGVLAASLLAVLGVSDGDVATDYAMSAQAAQRQAELRAKNETVDSKPNWPDWVSAAPPESMQHILAFVRREFGSMEGYLQSHGGDATLPERLRDALLDERSS